LHESLESEMQRFHTLAISFSGHLIKGL
jgi:hypothetical protein